MDDAWQKVLVCGLLALLLVPLAQLWRWWTTRRYVAKRNVVLAILLEKGATNLNAPLIVEHSAGRLKEIYSLLHRMERESWLSSYVPDEPLSPARGNRPRVCYRLTMKGSMAAAGLFHGAKIPS